MNLGYAKITRPFIGHFLNKILSPHKQETTFSMTKKMITFMILLLSVLYAFNLEASTLPKELCYLHPKPDTEWVLRETPIILSCWSEIHPLDFYFRVRGNKSGLHNGTTVLLDDGRTIRFKPFTSFLSGETVDVEITGAIDFSYRFKIRSQPVETFQNKAFKEQGNPNPVPSDPTRSKAAGIATTINGVSVPSDFPVINVQQHGEIAPGRLFFGSTFGTLGNYIIILNNDGTPYFYRKYPGPAGFYNAKSGDFKLQPTGVLTAFIYIWNQYVALDQNYNQINTYNCTGYETDSHDLILLPNGHSLIIGKDNRVIDMSQLVNGGRTNAWVQGNVIQELDSNKELRREWSCWDHYQIMDAVHENLTAYSIDFTHLNSIAVDYDSNLVISIRNLSEVTKIDWETGNVIWRFGGVNNEFQLIGDPGGISYQHHVRPVPGKHNHYTIFDNGYNRFPQYSRAVEYEIDPVNMIAEKVWEYRYTPDRFTHMMGSVQRLPNGNTYIDWSEWTLRTCEVDSNGKLLFDMESDDVSSYRTKRFEWEGIALTPYLLAESYNTGIALIFNKFGDENVDYYKIYGDTRANAETFLATSEETFAFLNNLQNNKYYYFRVTAVDRSGNESGFSNEEQIYASFIEPGQNMVQNGNFSSGRNQWSFHESNGASADTEIDGNEQYHIQINSGGTNLWDIQLFQDDLELINGRTYLFEFDAYADASRFIEAQIQKKVSPYYNYGEIDYSYLTAQKQHFAYEFTMTYANDLDAQVVFNCGQSNGNVYLDNVSFREVTEADVTKKETLPAQFRLNHNYPNPFNPSTEISFTLPKDEKVILKIYDLLGREVQTLMNGMKKTGSYQVIFDGSNLPSGIYIYKLQTPSFSQMYKMILIK